MLILAFVVLIGLAALASHLVAGAKVDVPVTASLAVSTGVGGLLGASFGQRLPQAMLARAFAAVVACVAIFLLVKTLFFGGPPQG